MCVCFSIMNVGASVNVCVATSKCVRACVCVQRSANSGQQLFHPQGNCREGKPSVLVVTTTRNKQPHPVPVGDKCC